MIIYISVKFLLLSLSTFTKKINQNPVKFAGFWLIFLWMLLRNILTFFFPPKKCSTISPKCWKCGHQKFHCENIFFPHFQNLKRVNFEPQDDTRVNRTEQTNCLKFLKHDFLSLQGWSSSKDPELQFSKQIGRSYFYCNRFTQVFTSHHTDVFNVLV